MLSLTKETKTRKQHESFGAYGQSCALSIVYVFTKTLKGHHRPPWKMGPDAKYLLFQEPIFIK